MKNLIILGASGFGRDVYYFASQSKGYNVDFKIKGFLDDNLLALDGHSGYPPILGTISDYIIQEDDVFTWSFGDVKTRKFCCQKVISRGGVFITLIHNSVIANPTAVIGNGCVITPNVVIGAGVEIGAFSLIQSFIGIGHDVSIGNYSRLDCFVQCVGGVTIGDNVTIHTGAIINHNVKIEDNSVIGANSFVVRNVKTGTTVYGNPATKIG